MRRLITMSAMVGLLCAGLGAYAFNPGVWPDGTVVMHMQLGSSGGALMDGTTSWGESAEASLAAWNPYAGRVRFQVVRDSTSQIASGNGVNNVFWADSIYGQAFGSSTLAVTASWWRGNTRTEADVLFNRAFAFNSYAGPLRPALHGGTLYDFRRVALHEFGHVLGLAHPDDYGQSVAAIMNSRTGNIDGLQPDDIAGVTVLYGGSAPSVTAPGPPGGLVAGSSGDKVSLAWRAPTSGGGPATYQVEAGSGAGAANLANFSTGGTTPAFSASGVGAGTYYIRVRAVNAAGVSGASNEAILIVGGGCSAAPNAPSALTGSATGSTVNLAWSAAGGNPTTYVVEAGSAPGLSNLANSDLGSATPSLTAPNIARGIYYVRVRGKNGCGVGSPSNEVTVIVQ